MWWTQLEVVDDEGPTEVLPLRLARDQDPGATAHHQAALAQEAAPAQEQTSFSRACSISAILHAHVACRTQISFIERRAGPPLRKGTV